MNKTAIFKHSHSWWTGRYTWLRDSAIAQFLRIATDLNSAGSRITCFTARRCNTSDIFKLQHRIWIDYFTWSHGASTANCLRSIGNLLFRLWSFVLESDDCIQLTGTQSIDSIRIRGRNYVAFPVTRTCPTGCSVSLFANPMVSPSRTQSARMPREFLSLPPRLPRPMKYSNAKKR